MLYVLLFILVVTFVALTYGKQILAYLLKALLKLIGKLVRNAFRKQSEYAQQAGNRRERETKTGEIRIIKRPQNRKRRFSTEGFKGGEDAVYQEI